MLSTKPSDLGVPAWVETFHRIVLHGTPDISKRDDLLRTWQAHASDLFSDTTTHPTQRFVEVVRSGFTHSLWRLTRGPATTVSTGILAALVGVAAAAFFVRDPLGLITSNNGLAFVGLLLLGYVFARYPTKPPMLPTALAFGFLVPSGLWSAWEHFMTPLIPSDRISSIGALTCVAGSLEFVRSSAKDNMALRARAWRLFAIGIGLIALSNFIGATQYASQDFRLTAAIASWIEVLLVASMLKNARSADQSGDTI